VALLAVGLGLGCGPGAGLPRPPNGLPSRLVPVVSRLVLWKSRTLDGRPKNGWWNLGSGEWIEVNPNRITDHSLGDGLDLERRLFSVSVKVMPVQRVTMEHRRHPHLIRSEVTVPSAWVGSRELKITWRVSNPRIFLVPPETMPPLKTEHEASLSCGI